MTDTTSSDLLEVLRVALAGRFDVERELGAGGMGRVFLGRDVTLDRPVAIKVIAPELGATAAIRDRFLREARTVARLRHPNIVAVYAAGETEGLLYFVMEYVEGESLRELLEREQRCDDARTRALLADLARALGYAHAAGVVHRDVKPENVLIDRDTGRAMLTDFGVARALAEDPSAATGSMTGTGFVVGSPRYMSPEQAMGERTLDGRSDLYSLGLVGYEMYAGAAPFSGSSPMAIITKQLTERPAPLADRCPTVPAHVAAAIDRALEKEPEARWPDGESLARALEDGAGPDATSRTRISAATPAAPPAARPARSRRPALWAGVAMLAALLLGTAYVTLRRSDGPPRGVDPRKSYLVTPFEVMSGDPRLGWLREGSVSMLALNLAQWRDLSVVGYERSLDLLREAKLDTARRIGLAEARAMARRAGAWTVVMGQVSSPGDSLLVMARLFDVATGQQVDQAQRSAAASADPRPLFDALTRDLLDLAGAPTSVALARLTETTTGSVEAYRAYLDGTRAMTNWQLGRADSLFALATRTDSNFALAYYHRAMVLGWRNTGDSAHRAVVSRAASLAPRLPARERTLVLAYADLSRALVAEQEGQRERAGPLFESAQRQYGAAVARDSGDAEAWYGLADALWHHHPDGWAGTATLRNWTRALRAFDRTLTLDSTFYLAYAHKVDLYGQAAGQAQDVVLEGDSLVKLDSVAVRSAAAAPRLAASRQRAFALALRDARAWTQAAPAPQAFQSLAYLYISQRKADSALAVLREALARPETRSEKLPFQVAMLEAWSDPAAARRTTRDAVARVNAARLEAEGGGDLLEVLIGAGRGAAVTGGLAEVDAIARLTTEVVATPGALGGREHPLPRWWALAVRLGLGVTTPALLRDLDARMAALDRLPAGGQFVRQHAAAGMYVAYLATRERRHLDALRRWRQNTGTPWTEVDALAALDARDTATAARLAQRFPSADSIRAANGWHTPTRWYARAVVLEELGDARGALAMYEVLEPRNGSAMGMVDPSWPLYARALLNAARLRERVGDRAGAARDYQRFLALWADADPVLEPQKQLARDGLARVRDAGGVVVPVR